MNPDLQPQTPPMNTNENLPQIPQTSAEKHLRQSASSAGDSLSCRSKRHLRRRFYKNFSMFGENLSGRGF